MLATEVKSFYEDKVQGNKEGKTKSSLLNCFYRYCNWFFLEGTLYINILLKDSASIGK